MGGIAEKGLGITVPPDLAHVTIYFEEKGCSGDLAMEFFREYEGKGWNNRTGLKISNWKVHAWEWIYYRNK